MVKNMNQPGGNSTVQQMPESNSNGDDETCVIEKPSDLNESSFNPESDDDFDEEEDLDDLLDEYNETENEYETGDSNDSDESEDMVETSDGKKLWIPQIPNENKPEIGKLFMKVEEAEEFYKDYAELGGFGVRLSNKKINREGIITNRYFLCSKLGIPKNKTYDTLETIPGKRKRRNTNFKRCGCKGGLKVKYDRATKQYKIYKFIEHHNHALMTEEEMICSKARRQLNYTEQKTVFNACTSKLGVSKTHRHRKSMKRGMNSHGGTVRDYQNYRRDMNTFVGNKDAQMLINTMTSRKKICLDYFFEYKCNEKELQVLFWADETAKQNYKEFGDTISFDTTFRTNK